MLPRINRLTSSVDFKRVYSTGKSAASRLFRLRAVTNGTEHTRIGIVVANAVSKRANQRNLLKRRMRESVRAFLPQLKPGMDIIISAQVSAKNSEFAQIDSELRKLCERAHLFA